MGEIVIGTAPTSPTYLFVDGLLEDLVTLPLLHYPLDLLLA